MPPRPGGSPRPAGERAPPTTTPTNCARGGGGTPGGGPAIRTYRRGAGAPLRGGGFWPGPSRRPGARPTGRAGRIMRSARRVPVAFVGGGFSGTILAAQLAGRGIGSVLIDGSGRAGKGVAYSTLEPAHLLNVPAEGMSAWSGEPDHFARRFESEGGEPRGFAQRRLFGRYLGEILDEAVARGKEEVSHATASKATRADAGWRIALDDGETLDADALVLAVGNQEPEALSAFTGVGRRFIRNPWGADARRAVEELAAGGDSALLVGTGLTMVDLVLSLDAAGHGGGGRPAAPRRG